MLLAYVNNEANRADVVQSVLDDARAKKIELLTSVLSITEVAFIATENADPDNEEDLIDQLWTPASPITLVDLSEKVAREARSVIRRARRERLKGIRSADALHLASAEVYGCTRFLTYEKQATRKQWSLLISAKVSEPYTDNPQLHFH